MRQNNLTQKENEVYFLVSRGFLSANRIAGVMCVTPSTIKQYLHNIYKKLDLEDNSIAGILYHYMQNPGFCSIHSVTYNRKTVSINDNYQI